MSNIIGIDVSKASLDCDYLRDVDQKRTRRLRCKNNVSCFTSLIAWAEARSGLPVESLAFIIEPTHVYHEQNVTTLLSATLGPESIDWFDGAVMVLDHLGEPGLFFDKSWVTALITDPSH